MGRHFYIIESAYDYDEHNSQIHYIGVNRKAAEHRMQWLFNFARSDFYGDRNDEYLEVRPPSFNNIDITNRDMTALGSAYIYDEGRGSYYNIYLYAMKTNKFCNAMEERLYKQEFPTKKF